MTDTPEAVRLADELDKWARDYATTDYTEDMATKSAALLRRIPELETARDVAIELAAQYAAERDQLRAELEKVRVPDVDHLAQFIRQIDGNHRMGAGALAEHIVEWLTSTPRRSERTVMSQHDTLTLREALRSIQYEAASLADAQVIALQALNATYPARAALSATQPAQASQGEPVVPPELDVRRIMLDIVPGDGDGLEVYAETVDDVVAKLTEMGERIEDLEGAQTAAPAQGAGEVVAWTWPGTMKRQFTDSKFLADEWVATGLPDVKALTYAPTQPAAGADVRLLDWAVGRWRDEVQNRPLVNKNRRPLDDAWRQVVRFAGGDPDTLLGPSHDAAIAASGRQE